MTLATAVDSYISAKRSRGAIYEREGPILLSFVRATGDIPVGEVSYEQARAFYSGSGPATRWQVHKHSTLRTFFKHLVGRGHLSASPLPDPPPRIRSTFKPYIYSREEIQHLLDATAILRDRRCPRRPETFRTLLLLLYGTGLRPGEARRLRLCDADLDDRILTVWNTKFFKSRLVPFGASLRDVLRAYREIRLALPLPSGDRSAFFATAGGKTLSADSLSSGFARMRKRAGIRNPQNRLQPRLQDVRHTFATGRLLHWYREGADVQARLPWLATYLGHADLSGTQAYLTMTPDLLAEASLRFQRFAESLAQGDAS